MPRSYWFGACFAAMRAALHLAESHAAQHGAYDVYIRARYDMYRLREGAMVPARVVTCCFRNVHARSLYWFDSSPAGVLRGVASRGGSSGFDDARRGQGGSFARLLLRQSLLVPTPPR